MLALTNVDSVNRGNSRELGRSRVLFLACFCLVSLSCIGTVCLDSHPRVDTLVQVWHSSGGPGPVFTSLLIDHEGRTRYKNPRGREFCARISPQKLSSLRDLLNERGLSDSAKTASERGEGYADYEDVEIITADWSAVIPRELVPPDVLYLLEVLTEIVEDDFGQDSLWSGWVSDSESN